MSIAKQEFTFRFGALNTDEGDKHLLPGELTISQNTVQAKENETRLREGYGRTAFAANVGSFIGAPDTYANTTEGRVILDGGGQVFVEDPTLGATTYRATSQIDRPFVRSVTFNDGYSDPVYVVCGNNEWMFAVGSPSGFSTRISWSVRDKNTGRYLISPTTFVASGVVHMTAIADATHVYVFYVTSSATVHCRRFLNSAPEVPSVLTTYQTVAGAKFREVDAITLSDGNIFVVAASFVSATSWHHTHSLLDKAAQVADVAPAPVTTTGVPHASGRDCCAGINILNYDGANGRVSYSLFRPSGAGDTLLQMIEVNTTTLAITANVTVTTKTPATSSTYAATTGYRDALGNRHIYSNINIDVTANGYEQSKLCIEHWSVDSGLGVTLIVDSFARSSWIASKPFQVGSNWFIVTGTTQSNTAATTATANRNGYHIRRADGYYGLCVAQIDFGLGPAVFHNRRFAVKGHADGDVFANRVAGVHAVTVTGSVASWGACSDSNVVAHYANFAETYAPGVTLGNKVLFPGPIPFCVGPGERIREMSPLMPPMPPTSSTPTGTNTYIQLVYWYVDSEGRVDRSGTSDLVGFNALPTSIECPALRHNLDLTEVARIGVYITNPGETTPRLRYVVRNQFATDTITVNIGSAGFDSSIPAESIYTIGDALMNEPPPQCKGLTIWRGRVIAYGTKERGRIVPSQELDNVTGPRWNAILASTWPDAKSDILRMEPCGWSDCAVFTATEIGVISGRGPDAKGGGAYEPQTIPAQLGIKNERAAVTGDKGCYFQASDDRYYLIAGAAKPIEIGKGVSSFTSPVSSCVHDPNNSRLIFGLQDANLLVLDYLRPTDRSPEGRWHVHTNTVLLRAYGMAIINGVHEFVETGGHRRTQRAGVFTDANASGGETSYNQILSTGDLAAFDLGHEFRVDKAFIHGVFLGNATLTLQVQGDIGTGSFNTSTHSKAFTAGPANMRAKPAGLGRVQAVRCVITIAGSTAGFVLNGITLVLQDRGHAKLANTSQRF